MIDKQAAHDAFGNLCGIDRAFRLMRIWTRAEETTSGDQFRLGLSRPKRTTTSVFQQFAREAGYSEIEIQAYLDLP